jgi:DNA-binding FadR family transcriptional regulator
LERAGIAAAVALPLGELEPLQVALAAMASAGSLAAFLEADQRFHQAIVGCLKSERLDRFFVGIQTEQTLVRAWRGDNSDREAIYGSHKRVVDAILARDSVLAESSVVAIVDSAESRLRRAGSLVVETAQSGSGQEQ